MARTFDEISSPIMGSLASQTTLVYDDKTGKRGKRPRIPKMKSFGDEGLAARSNHDREKKTKPPSPTFLPDYLVKSTGASLPSAHASPPPPIEKSSKKAKIKPLLRKFSSQEQMGVDLSRSAAEHQGIGILDQSRTPTRTPSGSIRKGAFHHRTTSGTSQISTSSSNHYVHPMRQTPQPYSSPLVASYKNSIDSSYSTEHQRRRPTHPPLHIRTGSHLTNNSQTNLPGTPSSLRFPSRSGNEPEIISPALATGRSSLESAFRKRSRSNTATTDPAQQAASVAQLRQKFQEKEAAKDRKYAEAEAKALRRKERKEQGKQRSRAASEQSSLVGVAYASREAFPVYGEPVILNQGMHPPHQRKFEQTPRLQSKDGMNEKGRASTKKVENGWMSFWIGVRAWLLRMSKKMGGQKKKKGE